jgi:hypothetical protein
MVKTLSNGRYGLLECYLVKKIPALPQSTKNMLSSSLSYAVAVEIGSLGLVIGTAVISRFISLDVILANRVSGIGYIV